MAKKIARCMIFYLKIRWGINNCSPLISTGRFFKKTKSARENERGSRWYGVRITV